MEGAARAAQRQVERDVALAWEVERMAREKRLRPLKHYLNDLKPRAPVSSHELVAAFESMKAGGLPVTITRLKKDKEA